MVLMLMTTTELNSLPGSTAWTICCCCCPRPQAAAGSPLPAVSGGPLVVVLLLVVTLAPVMVKVVLVETAHVC